MRFPAMRAAALAGFLSIAAMAAGQTAIPFVVNDLYVIPNSILGNYQPGPLTSFNGYGYFAATSAVNGRELYRTDGTPSGTTLVRDINPGTGDSSPDNFVVWNGALYFTADDGAHGREIWRTDGTAVGTRMIADVIPGPVTSAPAYIAATPNGLVFHESAGIALYQITNGTTVSTFTPTGACCLSSGSCISTDSNGCASQSGMWGGLGVACASIACNQPVSLACCMPDKSCVYLLAAACSAQGGTPNAPNFACAGCPDPAVFACCSPSGVCSVGPLAACLPGTFLFITLSCSPNPCSQTPFPCCLPSGQCFMLYVAGDCASHNGVVRASGGTCTSTTYDLGCTQPTFSCCRTSGQCTASSSPSSCRSSGGFIQPPGVTCASATCFVPNVTNISPSSGLPVQFGDRAIVFAMSNGPSQVWITDGSAAGTQRLANCPADVYIPSSSAIAGGRLYFTSSSSSTPPYALWSTDGTPAGTGPVAALAGVTVYGAIGSGNLFYFGSPDANNKVQIWRTDGTPQETAAITNFTGATGQPGDTTPLNGGVVFSAVGTDTRRRWFFAPGSPGVFGQLTTTGVANLYVPTSPGAVTFGSTALFAAYTQLGGDDIALWSTDGTPAGTRVVFPGINPTRFSIHAGRAYFMASDLRDPSRPEADVLWTTDGTAAGTSVVAHIPGSQQPSIGNLTPGANEDLYFSGQSAAAGNELFKTSGTPESTTVVKDIVPGANGSFPTNITYSNGIVLFDAKPTANAASPILYRTDGTGQGTYPIGSTIPNCCGGSSAQRLVGLGNQLFYFDTSPATGLELWRTDGSAAGPQLVADTVPGPSNGVGGPLPVIFNDSLYFGAANGIFRTDGTAPGTWRVLSYAVGGAQTQMLVSTPLGVLFTGPTGGLWFTTGAPAGALQLNVGGPSFDASGQFVYANGLIYFAGYAAATGWELWATDGTAAGTHLVTDLTPGNPNGFNRPGPSGLVAANGLVYFYLPASNGAPQDWYVSDGTPGGTHVLFTVAEFPHTIVSLYAGPASLLIATKEGTTSSRYDLWSYTGTVASLANLTPATTNESFFPFVDAVTAGGSTYLTRYDNSTFRAFVRTDGTPTGTTTILQSAFPVFVQSLSKIVRYGNDLAFVVNASASGGYLFRTMFPAASVQQVINFAPLASPQSLAAVGPSLYYLAPTSLYNYQLFVSNGTSGNNAMIGPVNTSFAQFNATVIRPLGNGFVLTDGLGLFRSDGTVAGSAQIGTFSGDWSLAESAEVSGMRLFRGFTATTGSELWRTDGTAAGTFMVTDLVPGTTASGPLNLARVGSKVFYRAQNVATQPTTELGLSDGTAAGTRVVAGLPPVNGISSPQSITDLNGLAIFVASSATSGGDELFRSDGTAAGTYQLKDILPGINSSYPRDLVAAGEYVFFTADNGVQGRELWRTDGSIAGTVLLKDICNGDLGSVPATLVAAGSRIFFTAYTPETGIELWTSDGTGPGTFMLFEIIPGPSSADIKSVTRAGNRIYFQATVPPQRPSLWSFDWYGSLTAHFLCAADYNRAGGPTVQDIFDFLNDWFAGASRADINGNGQPEVQDIFDFINIWLTGC